MEEFDYVVVGAGSAGCVVAGRLAEEPGTSVVLLEAGGRDSHPTLKMPVAFLKAVVNPRFNWGYVTEPEPQLRGRQLGLPRGRVLGGSSSINGMFYMRGHPLDYEDWKRLGATGWGYAEVLPYFRRMERSWRGESAYHGGAGPVEVNPINSPHLLHEPLMGSAVAAGFNSSADLAAEVSEGFARGEATIDKRGRRVSSATAYLRPAGSRRNLTVLTGVLVHRIRLENRVARGVEYEVAGERRTVRARREVILSAGTYNSPHLLMLSGVGPGEQLREQGIPVVAELPGVGRNLSEHPTVSMEFDALRPVTFLNQLRFDRVIVSALRWALLGSGPLATQLNSCNVVIRTRPGLDRPDVQFMANPLRFDAKIWFPLVTERQSHVFWAGVVGLHPRSRGCVRLKSPDPHVLAGVTLNLLSDPADLETLRAGMRAARHIYRTAPQARLTGPERLPGEALQSDDELDAFIRETVYVAMHPVGTCAMGSGREAVVDPQLRVIGVERLRVVDASVMPTVPGGNTHATTVMIAEKAVDIIRGVPPARSAV